MIYITYVGKPDIPLNENICYNDEIFLDITEDHIANIRDWYMISNYGRVYHKKMGRLMKTGRKDNMTYQRTMLCRKDGSQVMVDIHRLLMKVHFPVPNYDKLDVNHIDGNKSNNYYKNLEWCTRSENIKHAYDNNLRKIGQDNYHSKIDNNTAIKICELLSTNRYTNKEIANLTNTTISIVSGIKEGHGWKFISKDYNFYQRPGKLFSEEQIRNICLYFQNSPITRLTVNDQCRDALNYFGYNCSERYVDTVRKIYTRKYYTNISKDYVF